MREWCQASHPIPNFKMQSYLFFFKYQTNQDINFHKKLTKHEFLQIQKQTDPELISEPVARLRNLYCIFRIS